MTEQNKKISSGLRFNMWEQDENMIHLSIKNPQSGKESWLTSIDHT